MIKSKGVDLDARLSIAQTIAEIRAAYDHVKPVATITVSRWLALISSAISGAPRKSTGKLVAAYNALLELGGTLCGNDTDNRRVACHIIINQLRLVQFRCGFPVEVSLS